MIRHHVWREGGISSSGICLILFGAHVVRSLRIHQMWKSTPSSGLPGQLQMRTIHSCPTGLPSEHMRLLCFSNQYSGQGDRCTLKSHPRSSDRAGFFTCEPIVRRTRMTGLMEVGDYSLITAVAAATFEFYPGICMRHGHHDEE